MHSRCVNFEHHLSSSIWKIGGSKKNLQFNMIIGSFITQISYQRNSFRSVPFYFRQGRLFTTKKCMDRYNELALEPCNLCRCYSCHSKQPEQ